MVNTVAMKAESISTPAAPCAWIRNQFFLKIKAEQADPHNQPEKVQRQCPPALLVYPGRL